MRIENELKLDYSNVLIRPKRSTLGSRKEVDLERKFTFRNYAPAFEHKNWEDHHYQGIPIMASNMDGVGTMAVAEKLASLGLFTCLVKTYSEEALVEFFDSRPELSDYVAVSIGISDRDLIHFESVYDRLNTDIKYVCIDVANGYSERFVDFVKNFRNQFPSVVIIAGNVVTGEMTEELILNGVDIVKVGIGPGCFVPGQKVKTDIGLRNIEDINTGERVLTHTGSYKTVTNTFKFDDKKSIVNINGIKATPNHEFYVLHKKYRDIVTDENIHQYAEWIEAKDLTKDYLLLKHK